MSLLRLFGKSAANEAADRILASVMQAARDPELFGDDGAPDTLDGRFETATAFAVLALLRLKASPEADRVSQAFTDRLFRHFDAGLREAGVGDLSVARRMKGLAGAFYGRLAAYQAAIGADGALAEALGRNIWNTPDAAPARALAHRLRALHAAHAAGPPQALEEASRWAVLP